MTTKATQHEWEVVLDRLELDLAHAEGLLDDPTGSPTPPEPWVVPTLSGPIPAALVDRAREIHARQRLLQEELARTVNAARRQHRFADRVSKATAPSADQAVYVDVDA